MRVHLHCRAQFSTSGTSFPKLNLFPKLLKSYSDPTDDFEATGDSGLSLGPARLLLHKEAYRAWETLFGVTRSPDVCRSHPLAAPSAPNVSPDTRSPCRWSRSSFPVRSAGPAARTTHVSSKCCSKVASIPPAIGPSPRPRSKTLPASRKDSVT